MATAQPKAHSTASSTPAWRKIGVPVAIVSLLIMAVLLLPKGYNTDLTQVGNGHYAVVQIFDKNTVQSEELMDTVNKVRRDYEKRGVEFLVADMGTDPGRSFAQSHGAQSATALIFGPRGRLLTTFMRFNDAAALTAAIDHAVSAGGAS